MGIFIVAIIENKLSPLEILELPEEISKNWIDILPFYNDNFIAPWTTLKFEKILDIKSVWNAGRIYENNVNHEYIITALENRAQYDLDLSNPLITLYFNKKTIKIEPSSHHKYANLYEFETRNFVLRLIRLVATKLGAKEIIYCADSAVSTAYLDEMSHLGATYFEIKEKGQNLFGNIPQKLSDAVFNYFFIDDFELNLEDYSEDVYIFNRSNEEYFLEQKFGQHMIINRGNYFPKH